VNEYCRDSNFSLNNACFYSDSKNDLPLLEAVNMPIAVNPDKNLKNIAKSKNWMIINN
jgi:phosphoserine phosphatase